MAVRSVGAASNETKVRSLSGAKKATRALRCLSLEQKAMPSTSVTQQAEVQRLSNIKRPESSSY